MEKLAVCLSLFVFWGFLLLFRNLLMYKHSQKACDLVYQSNLKKIDNNEEFDSSVEWKPVNTFLDEWVGLLFDLTKWNFKDFFPKIYLDIQ
jgi:hypothetical protein